MPTTATSTKPTSSSLSSSSSSSRTSRRRRKPTTNSKVKKVNDYDLDFTYSSTISSFTPNSTNSDAIIKPSLSSSRHNDRPSSSSSSSSYSSSSASSSSLATSHSSSSRSKKKLANYNEKENQINESNCQILESKKKSFITTAANANANTMKTKKETSRIKKQSSSSHSTFSSTSSSSIDQHYLSILEDVKFIQQQQEQQQSCVNNNNSSNITGNEIAWNEIIESHLLQQIINQSIHFTRRTIASLSSLQHIENNIRHFTENQIYNIMNIARKCIRHVVMKNKSRPTKQKNNTTLQEKNNEQQQQQQQRANENILQQSCLKLEMTYLRIAMHCIRSILPYFLINQNEYDTNHPHPGHDYDGICSSSSSGSRGSSSNNKMNNIKMMKKIMKLLYHIITTIEDVCQQYQYSKILLDKVLTNHHDKEEEEDDDENHHHHYQQQQQMNEGFDLLCHVTMIGLSSFQMLGIILEQILIHDLSVECVKRNNDGSILNFFPIPSSSSNLFYNSTDNSHKSTSSGSSRNDENNSNGNKDNDDDLTNEQIIKIAIQSVISASIILWNVHLYQIHQSICDTDSLLNQKLNIDNIKNDDKSDFERTTTTRCNLKLPFRKMHENQYGPALCSLISESLSYGHQNNFNQDHCNFPFNTSSFQFLLCRTAISWIHLLMSFSKEGNDTKDCMKVSNSFLSRMSKLLLDAGMTLDSLSRPMSLKNNDQSEKSAVDVDLLTLALHLKQDSIMTSLHHAYDESWQWTMISCMKNSSTTSIISSDVEKRFERACYYASKYSTTYQQQLKDVSRSLIHLRQFHSVVGNALNEMILLLDQANVNYTEYCSYRALHLSAFNSNMMICQEEDRIDLLDLKTNMEQSDCVEDALMTLFYTSLQIKEYLELNATFGNGKDAVKIGENAIELFRCVILVSDTSVPLAQLVTCQRILSRLKLVPFVTNIAKEVREGEVKYDPDYLYALGRIIGECCSPLNYLISKGVGVGKEQRKYFEYALDGYLRAGAVLDAATILSLNESSERCPSEMWINHADRYISKCGTLCRKCELQSLEYVAKAISNMAKARLDNEHLKVSSICPYIISLDVYSDLHRIQRKTKIQLYARYSHFASLLISLGMKREACVALCYASNYLVTELIESGNTHHICDILLYSDEFYNGKMKKSLFQSRQLDQYLAKLAQLYISILSETYTSMINEQMESSLKKSPFGSTMLKASEWNKDALLGSITRLFVSASSQHLVLINELFAVIGLNSVSKLLLEDGHERFQRDFDNSIILIAKASKNRVENIIALYFAAASIMHGLASTYAFQSCAIRASYYIDRAYDISDTLTQQQKSGKEKLVKSLTYKASLSLLKHGLKEKDSIPHKLLENTMCESASALRLMYNEQDESLRSTISLHFGMPLLWIVVRIYQSFCSDNSSASASDQMTLIYDYSSSIETFTGFECIAAPLLLKGELYNKVSCLVSLVTPIRNSSRKYERQSVILDRISSLVCEDSIEESLTNILSHAFEMASSRYPLHLLSQLQEGFETFRIFFSRSIEVCTKSQQNRSQMALSISALWWMSTCQEILCREFYEVGDMIRSLDSVRRSMGYCKQGLSFYKLIQNSIHIPHMKEFTINSFSMMFITSTALRQLFKARIHDCYEYIAKIYISVGDCKRAKSYIIASGESFNLIPKDIPLPNGGSIEDVIKILNPNITSIRHMMMKNTLIDIFTQSTSTKSYKNILNLFSKDANANAAKLQISTTNLDWLRELIQYFFLLQQRVGAKSDDDFSDTGLSLISSFLSIYSQLPNSFGQMGTINDISDFIYHQNPSNWCTYTDTMSMIGLFVIESNLKENNQNESKRSTFVDILHRISFNEMVSAKYRCNAFFLLGHEYLWKAREAGELQTLWKGIDSHNLFSDDSDNLLNECVHSASVDMQTPNLDKAKHHFYHAVSFAGPASSKLSRESMRCLALVSGPCHFAGELIHTSIGSSARQKTSFSQSKECKDISKDDTDSIFTAFDVGINDKTARDEELRSMYHKGKQVVPPSWNFVAMCLCPTGELLISRLYLDEEHVGDLEFKYHTTCVFPETSTKYHENCLIVDTILKPFEALMEKSKSQLSGIDGDVANNYNADTSSKIEWWKERDVFDNELSDLLMNFQIDYFEDPNVKECIFNSNNEDSMDASFSGSNLASKFEAACKIENEQTSKVTISESFESLQKLTVKQLKQRLGEFNIEAKTMRSLRKAGLIELLLEKLREEANIKSNQLRDSLNDSSSHLDYETGKERKTVTFLVLDEHLCRFPFEGLPMLKGKTVCRLPSFPFALSTLLRARSERDPVHIDSAKTTFVLDPESNLSGTQKRLSAAISNISESCNWNWGGIIGKKPPQSFMQAALTQENGLFLYFGHGGGESCFSRNQIESLIGGESKCLSRKCKSSIMLMGCSSGMLQSVNQKAGGPEICEEKIHCEPEGVALSYLCAGAPCVVGNLWDVTDRDIDRFSIALLERLFLSNNDNVNSENIAECVAQTRDVCKMKHIVGCAPVVYGVPVWILKNS